MTSSRRSMFAAVSLFLLIAISVLGSMTWASVASYQLATKNVEVEHATRIERALRQIESHMMGIINSEAARPFWDYFDRYPVEPEIVTTKDGRQLDPDLFQFVVSSQLALAEPPQGWMDLHFQITPQGTLGSPQIPDATTAWSDESTPFTPEYARRARQTWNWLEKIYPSVDLREQIAESFRQERSDEPRFVDPLHARWRLEKVAEAKAEARAAGKFGQQTLRSSQQGYLPPPECVHPELAAQNIRNQIMRRQPRVEGESTVAEHMSLEPGEFAPAFWVAPRIVGQRKLAFVREYGVDADVFYQGFIGDFGLLQTELLSEIADVFPDAELEPIDPHADLDQATLELKLPYVPAVLRVPEIPVAAAWASIRWQLFTSWAGAAAVLVIAGLGVRNLVSLTNRRMQFAYAVTHELRTPLTTFRLYSDMLSAGLVPESAKQEYLDTLNRESVRLSRLVEEVLEYARLENQKVRLHVTQTDAPGLLRAVGETLDKVCRHNGIEGRVVNHIPNGKVVRTDINVVNQIAGVLVNNACRHARSSPTPMVLLELGAENGRVHLDVIDTGAGVDRADSRRIFKPFRRGKDADRAARGGIGLGLALARNWATLLGGRLDLVARHHPQHRGAHFRLTIPSSNLES